MIPITIGTDRDTNENIHIPTGSVSHALSSDRSDRFGEIDSDTNIVATDFDANTLGNVFSVFD